MLLIWALLASFAAGASAEPEGEGLAWWQKTNAYEIYVNSFQDTDGNGYGDINGIARRLDHLQSLGVGAVWLTPVFVSPMADNGYDVADYYTINPLYGSNADMDALIEAANYTGEEATIDLAEAGVEDVSEAQVLLSSYDGIDENAAKADRLRPYEAIVVKVR